MNKILVIATLVIPLVTTQSFANEATSNQHENVDEETIGFGIGSVVGGILGGPVGLMAGALTGALVGDSVGSDKEIKLLTSNMDKTKSEINTLHKNNLEKELALKDAHSSIEKLLSQNQELKLESLEFAVQFRTNSSNIENHYQDQLIHLAEILSQAPGIEINIDGFADRMGDETFNMELSGKRAAAVKEFLISQGIEKERILAHAYGESKPIKSDESLENNFFDRRVSISLNHSEAENASQLSVATN